MGSTSFWTFCNDNSFGVFCVVVLVLYIGSDVAMAALKRKRDR